MFALDRVSISDRKEASNTLGAERRYRSLGNQRESARKLNDAQRVRIHGLNCDGRLPARLELQLKTTGQGRSAGRLWAAGFYRNDSMKQPAARGGHAQRPRPVVFSVQFSVWRRSSLRQPAQFLSSDGVDGAAICTTFELGKNLAHDCSNLRRAASDCCSHCSAKLVFAHLSGKVFLECRRFGG